MCTTNSSHNLDASFDLVLPEDGQWSLSPTIEKRSISPSGLSPSDIAGTIDPSLLGSSELPPLPPSTGARKSKPLPTGPIIYVRRPPGVSASQEALALSDKVPGKSRRNTFQKKKYVGKGRGKAVERPRVYIGDARCMCHIRVYLCRLALRGHRHRTRMGR
ncbi:hypothetical protein BDR07DRAFT_1393108 [Suillus spraguei]|nr:hypothetical protein BDR07DRAFT_1393108 [Suillus spraguei]